MTTASDGQHPEADEFHRQRRLVDQTMTMQSVLRDRYRRRAKALRLVELFLSVFGLGFAFAGQSPSVTILGITASRPTWLGVLALVAFCLTIVDLVIDPAGLASQHDAAVRSLAALKDGYRVTPPNDELKTAVQELGEQYGITMDNIPPVPERTFLSLKSRHLRKVAASKLLSDHPGLGPRVAALTVRWQAIGAARQGRRGEAEGPQPEDWSSTGGTS